MPDPKTAPTPSLVKPLTVAVLILLGSLVTVKLMGRPIWCDCGSPAPWVGDVTSTHESKHLVDPYSLSHFIYGLGLYAILRRTAPSLTISWRVAIATALSTFWEVVENTPWVIDRFRQGTITAGYSGDGLVNSATDTLCAVGGFLVAARVPWQASIALAVAIELGCLIGIRDGLTVNTIMLIHPLDVIRAWQQNAPAP